MKGIKFYKDGGWKKIKEKYSVNLYLRELFTQKYKLKISYSIQIPSKELQATMDKKII
jgi:hypothetical protein